MIVKVQLAIAGEDAGSDMALIYSEDRRIYVQAALGKDIADIVRDAGMKAYFYAKVGKDENKQTVLELLRKAYPQPW